MSNWAPRPARQRISGSPVSTSSHSAPLVRHRVPPPPPLAATHRPGSADWKNATTVPLGSAPDGAHGPGAVGFAADSASANEVATSTPFSVPSHDRYVGHNASAWDGARTPSYARPTPVLSFTRTRSSTGRSVGSISPATGVTPTMNAAGSTGLCEPLVTAHCISGPTLSGG